MEGEEEILPNVFKISSISESKDSVFLIDCKTSLDLFALFLDDVSMNRLILLRASNAAPGVGVFVPTDFKRVDKGQLVLVR